MKKVLLVSASAGAGHVRAAQAVERALALEDPRASVAHLDVLSLAGRLFRDAYSKGYLALVSHAPALWAYLYERLDRPARRPPSLRRLVERWNTRRLRHAVAEFAPDVVVCTHFLPAEVLAAERRRGRLTARLGTVVTDRDVHRLWVHRGVDRYFVAGDEAAALLGGLGFGAEAVEVTGIPVDPRFGAALDRGKLREALGVPDGPLVLVLGGGAGVGPIQELVRRLEQARTPARIVAVAGRNERLRRALAASAGPRTSVLGFTSEIAEWMAAADLLVTKPGGLTSAEALARGLPMLLVSPIPGQEQRNSDVLLEAGAAARVGSLDVVAWKVDDLLGNPARLAAMRVAASRVARPDAAFRVARWALGGG